jgi:tetratricopeptide (TPR) repeat protein
MPKTLSVGVALLVVLLGSNAFAQATEQSKREEAESHYLAAVRLFGEGRYREALDEFDEAIADSPESIFYCNRAVALIKLQEPEAALESLQTCQETHAGGEEELAEIDAQRQAVGVIVGNIRTGVLSTVSAINAPDEQPPIIQPRRGWTRVETGIVLAGVGVASLASAATLDFLSQDLKTDLESASTAPLNGASISTRQQEYDAVRKRYVTRQRIFIGLTAAGAAFTVTGAVLTLSGLVNRNKETPVAVIPHLTGVSARVIW